MAWQKSKRGLLIEVPKSHGALFACCSRRNIVASEEFAAQVTEKGAVSVSEVLGKSKTLNLPGPSARLSDLLLPVSATRPPLSCTTVAAPVATEVGGATVWMGECIFSILWKDKRMFVITTSGSLARGVIKSEMFCNGHTKIWLNE